ncbi:hypothetical protein SAMN05421788_106202 [Filimonas lacunae]|uniref:Transmembrane protein n=1 Tax=Filimonas lacunae TaxID=477680 RepID=A0A173MEW7_9BACT|nr:hypothetical protein [Filimonas lacunae]BAV06142.1 hypothetical protein FLA_2157 [Filimonas lacunae]SIT24860.1 hypothetical protein SAMN05421788_106202 [Filimonas lacunae]
MALSSIGIFHTIVGLGSLVAAIISYVQWGRINLSTSWGKIYFYGTSITALTALAISKHGGFNAGHGLSVVVFLLLLVSLFLHYQLGNSKTARYFENFLLSFTFFFSWVPTVNETFTRLPLSHPLATGPADPVITRTLLLLFILFIVGSVYQFIRQRKVNHQVPVQ